LRTSLSYVCSCISENLYGFIIRVGLSEPSGDLIVSESRGVFPSTNIFDADVKVGDSGRVLAFTTFSELSFC
jgi:hypothetical protein